MKKLLDSEFFNADNIIICAVSVFWLICLLLMFAPAVSVSYGFGTFSGLQITFGKSEMDILGFSFGYFITYLFVIAGLVLSIISFVNKVLFYEDVISFVCGLIAFGCFLFAGVFFFQAVPYCNFHGDKIIINIIEESATIGGGAIASGIFSLICSGLMGIFAVKGFIEENF